MDAKISNRIIDLIQELHARVEKLEGVHLSAVGDIPTSVMVDKANAIAEMVERYTGEKQDWEMLQGSNSIKMTISMPSKRVLLIVLMHYTGEGSVSVFNCNSKTYENGFPSYADFDMETFAQKLEKVLSQ